MNQQLLSNDKNTLTSFIISSTQNSSSEISNRRDSAISSTRRLSPIAFFQDGVMMNEIDLRNKLMASQRRARAIATAPRRKRYDDDNEDKDDDIRQKGTLFEFIKPSAVSIPIPRENQSTDSLPLTQPYTGHLPTFRVDPPSQDDCAPFDCTSNNNSCLNHYSSVHSTSRNEDWKA